MKALIKGRYMEDGKGYDKKDKETKQVIGHVEEIIVYSAGETVTISGLNGKDFAELEEVTIPVNIRAYDGRLFVSYDG